MNRIFLLGLLGCYCASSVPAEGAWNQGEMQSTPKAIQAPAIPLEAVRLQYFDNAAETAPAPTELDAALDALLALPEGERMRAFGAICRTHRLQTFQAHLGANGEFIGGPLECLGCEPPLIGLPYRGGFWLWANVEIDEAGTGPEILFATVDPSGKVERTYLGEPGTKSMPAIPTDWPRDDKTGHVRPLELGEILSGVQGEESNSGDANAESQRAWLMLGLHQRLISPYPHSMRPPNVLWIVPNGGGFDLVHSGPLHRGLYARIREDFSVTYGEGAPEELRTSSKQKYWPFETGDTGRVTEIPPGTIIGMAGSRWPAYRVLEGGLLAIGTIEEWEYK